MYELVPGCQADIHEADFSPGSKHGVLAALM
jgi:hypothetical protein